MVWVMGISRGAGAGLGSALDDVDGEMEGVVERDSNDISFGRELGFGDGARASPAPRVPFRPDDLNVSSAGRMFLDDWALGSVLADGEAVPELRDKVS